MSEARICAFCEHFDGGGEAAVRPARNGEAVIRGDCLNSLSPTVSDDTCPQFYPDTCLEMSQRHTVAAEVSPETPAKHPSCGDSMPQRQI